MFKYFLLEWHELTDREKPGLLCRLVGCNPIAGGSSSYAYAGHCKKCGYKKK